MESPFPGPTPPGLAAVGAGKDAVTIGRRVDHPIASSPIVKIEARKIGQPNGVSAAIAGSAKIVLPRAGQENLTRHPFVQPARGLPTEDPWPAIG